jgi:hypothetical protein
VFLSLALRAVDVDPMRRFSLAVACAFTLACAKTTPSALTPEGARVRVSDASGVEGCESIGDFSATQPGARPLPIPWGSGQIRNLAAKSGATDVVWDDKARGHNVGEGYRCP